MNVLPIFSLNNPVNVNDWYLLFMTVCLVLSLMLMGPFHQQYSKGMSVMFRFNSPESDICFPMFSPLGYVTVSIVSCISLGLVLSPCLWDVTEPGPGMILKILSASGLFGLFCAVKLLLYQIINGFLYNSQSTTLKPIRWNGFFVMAFSAVSFIILILAIIVLFLGLPHLIIVIGAFLALIVMETGLIFRLKTSLFKKKYSILGFIMYLCALEFGPIVLMLVLLSKTLS